MSRAALRGALLWGGAALMAFPFAWMIVTSLKPAEEAQAPTALPSRLVPGNYAEAWERAATAAGGRASFGRFFLNSAVVAVAVTAGVVVSSVLAGYAFARMRFPGKRILFALFLATMMIPFEVTVIPNFVTIKRLGLMDTYGALIFPWLANAFSVFLMRQRFASMPRDLYEAAQLDGCGHWRFVWSVAVPWAAPVITTVALFAFLGSWNAFVWPLVVTSSPELGVVQTGLSVFLKEASTDYHLLMAACTMTVAPVLVLFALTQRTFIEGVAGGAMR